jgi:hypothetical protein
MSVAQALKTTPWPSLRALVARTPWLEDAVVVAGAFLASLHAEWRIISGPLVFNQDAEIHEFWMRRFQDPALFRDPLTKALVESGYQPEGFRALFWLASHLVDPVSFGELTPLALQPLSVWLIFRIVRAHSQWRPAAWIAAALFLVPWEVLRFSGGHPRAFAQPIVLLTVFFLLRRPNLAAAAMPPVGFLFYPPAGLAALVIVSLASLERGRAFLLNTRRLRAAALSVAAVASVVLVPRLLTGRSEHLISAAQAHKYPEFGPHGQMHFFASSTLAYLKHNYSGFYLQDAGSILAIAALVLLVARPRNALHLRWEVWCMAIASLGLFAVAHGLLFRLYLPHRYTYPLLPFFCIVIALSVRPTLAALAARSRLALVLAPALSVAAALLALTAFPLGPQLSLLRFGAWLGNAAPYLAIGFAIGLFLATVVWVRTSEQGASRAAAAVAAAAIVASSVLVAEVAFAGGGDSGGSACRDTRLYDYLQGLPKDAIIAGDPLDMNCIPIAARRPVVISQKLYQPWNTEYLVVIRERMFRTVRAYYGSSIAALVGLRTRYGADYLVVRTRVRTHVWRGRRMAPFSWELARLLRSVDISAAHRLPETCETWRNPKYAVYSLACVAAERSQ